MQYGVYMFSTDYSMRPDDLAREVEQRGFESLWLPEHTHIPASRISPHPSLPELPRQYWHTLLLIARISEENYYDQHGILSQLLADQPGESFRRRTSSMVCSMPLR